MVENIRKVVMDYEKCWQEIPFVPRFPYGHQMLREDGAT